MRSIEILTIVAPAIFCLPVSAIIINVPDDYTTIQAGIDASANGDTVLVSDGCYFERINFNGKGILLGSEFIFDNSVFHVQNTIIDADTSVIGVVDTASVVCFVNDEDTTSMLQGFTIRNGIGTYINEIRRVGGGMYCGQGSIPQIKNNVIRNNSADYGGGVFCYSAIIKTNTISMNFAYYGGGVYCYVNGSILDKNIIYDNISTDGGGGMASVNDNSTITNCTISINQALAGGGILCHNSTLALLNVILWDNNANHEDELYVYNSTPLLTYCDIQGGWAGQGNIDADPLFNDSDNGDFHITADSPCIDAGCPESPLDPDGTRSDIGALYFDQAIGIDSPILQVPRSFNLMQNYPNPFNASTMIRYELPERAQVKLDIYDILGRKVTTIEDGLRPAGYHQVLWKADGIASGVYFYKLQAGEYVDAKKMLLVK